MKCGDINLINYKIIEDKLNFEGKRILLLIREDYYQYMSDEKKQLIDRLIDSDIIVVNQGQSIFKDNTLAHGGRALKDEKIHFYPDVRSFESNEQVIDKCKKILLHECFHYLLQPDKVKCDSALGKEILHYYTEGLVEKESRIFYERHKDEIDFEKANYGFNINFVNFVQSKLNVGSNEVIFGEENYLKSILNFASEYDRNEKNKNQLLDIVKEISKEFPENMQRKVHDKMRTIILQNGNVDIVQEKLQEFDFIKRENINKLKENHALEL